MAEFMGQQSTGQPGRHRHRPRTGRTWVIVAVVVAIVAGAGLTWFVRSQQTSDATTANAGPAAATSGQPVETATVLGASGAVAPTTTSAGSAGCGLPGGTLTVAAAPDIADVIGQVTLSAGPAATAG